MVEPPSKEKFEEIGERDVHEPDKGKVRKVGEQKCEEKACVDLKGPTGSDPMDRISEEDEAEDFEKALAERIKKKKKMGAPMRLGRAEKVG